MNSTAYSPQAATPRTFAKIGISHGHQALVYTFPVNNSGRINSELLNAAHKEFERTGQVPTRAWCEERGMDKSCSYKVIEQLLLKYK
ncbi:MAG: hypothetical protein QF371_08010 [Flavobacteriales bacterium]|nr:hypothetical protein [Flavobacteriales bacterium]